MARTMTMIRGSIHAPSFRDFHVRRLGRLLQPVDLLEGVAFRRAGQLQPPGKFTKISRLPALDKRLQQILF